MRLQSFTPGADANLTNGPKVRCLRRACVVLLKVHRFGTAHLGPKPAPRWSPGHVPHRVVTPGPNLTAHLGPKPAPRWSPGHVPHHVVTRGPNLTAHLGPKPAPRWSPGHVPHRVVTPGPDITAHLGPKPAPRWSRVTSRTVWSRVGPTSRAPGA